ncbi:MAG: IclR family transcriptional regulator [Chloroflexota bacterium]
MLPDNQTTFTSQKIDKQRPNDVISSVVRAFSIMELLSEYPSGLLPKEVAYKLNINISTCYHQLNTMLATGYVSRNVETSRFYLTPKIQYQKSFPAFHSPADVVGFLNPHLNSLQQSSEESAYLSLWNGHDIYIADMVLHAGNVLVDQLYVGFNSGNHSMALGKVILSNLAQATMEDYIDRNPLVPYTNKTITNPRCFAEHLDMVSTAGYSTDQEESFEGVFCFGMPVYGVENRIIGSMGITTTQSKFRQQDDLYLEMLAQVSNAASLTLATVDCIAVAA